MPLIWDSKKKGRARRRNAIKKAEQAKKTNKVPGPFGPRGFGRANPQVSDLDPTAAIVSAKGRKTRTNRLERQKNPFTPADARDGWVGPDDAAPEEWELGDRQADPDDAVADSDRGALEANEDRHRGSQAPSGHDDEVADATVTLAADGEDTGPPLPVEDLSSGQGELVDANMTGSEVTSGASGLIMVRAADIKPEKPSWLWPKRVARRHVTMLYGDPGMGKSQVAMSIAATVSRGGDWPGGEGKADPEDVIILSAEDDPNDTILPRLNAAGADLGRVHIVKAVSEGNGTNRTFNLPTDLDLLQRIKWIERVGLIIIDPATAYIGGGKGARIDRNNAGDVRALLTRLETFAEAHDLAILAISHLTKRGEVSGSFEWLATPRFSYFVTTEPGTDRRLFLARKNNIGARSGLAFRIEQRMINDEIETSAVVWEEPVMTTAEEAQFARRSNSKATTGKSEGIRFLEHTLKDGAMDAKDVIRLGRDEGLSVKNLRDARETVGVVTTKMGFGKNSKSVWTLPSVATAKNTDGQPQS